MRVTGFRNRLDEGVINQIGMTMQMEEMRREDEGIPFTSSDRYTLLNQLMFAAHMGMTPRQLTMGRVDKKRALQNVSITMQNGEMIVEYDIVANEAGTGTDPAAGDPLIDNPLTNPTFGAAGGVIPPLWLDMMIRQQSRFLQAKNFAKIVPMSAPVDMAPLKTTKSEDWLSGIKPVKEGRAGVDVRTAYSLWKFDAYKYFFHSGLTLEIVKASAGKIAITEDLVADLMEAFDLLIDLDYFESQYVGITLGKIRRFDTTADNWANNADVARGAAAYVTSNAKKHVLWYSIADKKLYVPAVGVGDENKFQSSTAHPDGYTNLELWDVFPFLAGLLKDKRARMDYTNLHPALSLRVQLDSRFTNSLYKTGNVVFASENGYLGRVPLGGTSTGTDLWEMPQGILDDKVTSDGGAYKIYPVLAGQYQRPGLIGPWIPPGLTMDKGFEVKSVDSVDVLRPNNTDVFSVMGEQAVIPWDLDGLVLLKVVKEAHT
jgi:hypothetical protein